jgi:hypothetical protein
MHKSGSDVQESMSRRSKRHRSQSSLRKNKTLSGRERHGSYPQCSFQDGIIVSTPVGARIDVWAALGNLSAELMKVDSPSRVDNRGKCFTWGMLQIPTCFQSKPETRAGREGDE